MKIRWTHLLVAAFLGLACMSKSAIAQKSPRQVIDEASAYIWGQGAKGQQWSLKINGTHFNLEHFTSGTYEWWEGDVSNVESVKYDDTTVYINANGLTFSRSFAGSDDPRGSYCASYRRNYCDGKIPVDDIPDSSAIPHVANAFQQAFNAAKHLGDARHADDPF